MKIKKTIVVVIVASLLIACGSEKEPEHPKSCLESMPETISGLKVSGARTEKNVINNLWPIICRAQELYARRMKENPELGKGTVALKMAVEFNGEIGAYSIVRNTTGDPELEKMILKLFQFMDFAPFGAHNSESEIVLPIHFKP
ncbi:hypothetical protein DSCA_23440 [Desulfosarcina alkanivorans]|uniref:TonB C-terminal domain-containing protein n=1 Tax=Desulfosarcina alkanivorans TaxID=571177 RepID=A0A5K7YQ30_9BACT|nr:hypothetical protein [Desulfosarcina alkanivorans]BBO68414.1 hypothetical protein DSCA_23440 [Desulfosarcina alkanivorans]